jgi:predicted RNA binding protein YcfA (HicA-like mRNA interferase family)
VNGRLLAPGVKPFDKVVSIEWINPYRLSIRSTTEKKVVALQPGCVNVWAMKVQTMFSSKRSAVNYLKARGWKVTSKMESDVYMKHPTLPGDRVVVKTSVRGVWRVTA